MDLKFGDTNLAVAVPEQATVMEVRNPPQVANEDRFRADLTRFLADHCFDLSQVAVVVADKTRLCDYPLYLPVLLQVLEGQEAVTDHVTFYIAYGTHARQSDEACRRAYGELYDCGQFVHHDGTQGDLFQELGLTPRGTPVYRRKDLERATWVITFGAISHHYFAGYGGGRKLLFPGLGYRPAIYHNHGLFLDGAADQLAPGCQPGRVLGNPLAEDLAAVEAFAPADLDIHGLLDSNGKVCDLLVGQGREHFQGACRRHGQYFERLIDHRYDLVVASCGGFPKDINFIQSHKAIHHGAAWVKDGGTLIVLAECRDGIGSETFLPWFNLSGWQEAFQALQKNYVGNGGTALALMAKTRRIRIFLVTRLPAHHVQSIGCGVLLPGELQTRIETHTGSLAVIPNASMLVGTASEKAFQS